MDEILAIAADRLLLHGNPSATKPKGVLNARLLAQPQCPPDPFATALIPDAPQELSREDASSTSGKASGNGKNIAGVASSAAMTPDGAS